MPAVFSRQFLRSLVNTVAAPSAVLHGAARRCVDRLASHVAASQDPALGIAVAVALQRHGGVGFDRLSKTKTTAKLLQVRHQAIVGEGEVAPARSIHQAAIEVAARTGSRAVESLLPVNCRTQI